MKTLPMIEFLGTVAYVRHCDVNPTWAVLCVNPHPQYT